MISCAFVFVLGCCLVVVLFDFGCGWRIFFCYFAIRFGLLWWFVLLVFGILLDCVWVCWVCLVCCFAVDEFVSCGDLVFCFPSSFLFLGGLVDAPFGHWCLVCFAAGCFGARLVCVWLVVCFVV